MSLINWEHINVPATLGSAALVVAALLLILIVNRFFQSRLLTVAAQFQWRYETVNALRRAISGALLVLAAFLLLGIWGVALTPVWTFLVSAITIVGVGFLATWAMVSNVTANFFLAVWRPFGVGDQVEMLPENFKGRVVERNLMFTVLREEGGSATYVPNNLFFQKMFRVVDGGQRTLFEETETNRRPRAGGPGGE